MNPLNETVFEEHIAEYLAASPLYNQRKSSQFDIDNLVDREMLEHFLQAQTTAWQRLQHHFPGRETEIVVAEVNKFLNRGDSMLTLFNKGITIKGTKIKFMMPKPVLEEEDSSNYQLYLSNRFSVVRQMRYSTTADDSGNELDMCILLNGLPLMTFELKNEGTNQNYGHGIYQYRNNRSPVNRMLRNCLVHFVMDNCFVFMTTKLNGEQTRFLPFNKESTNPVIEGEYPTAYMWQEILQADSLLDILEHFIKRYNDEDGKPIVIFPRFHQLRAVRKLRQMVVEEGPGHNYLIQHSAGSGKTKSMAWLAHQLANMTNADHTPVFDSIIMVTDRIVLNRNMADDVVNFQTVAGTVKDIRRGSKNLATALNEGNRIIISTVQKFAYALKDLKRDTQRKYAIIVDEAHTAIGNESAKDLVNALSTDSDLHNMPDFNPDEYEDQTDALLAYMQVMRRMMKHISYFAFTATPKDKTYKLFGIQDGPNKGKAHDLYSMKQAIDEKFILDVLANYKSYLTMFELIEKNPDEDQKKLFEEKKALKVIYGELNKNAYIMLRKAHMMLEHFMQHTINKIGHKAKAMVVCDSRRAAADYKQLLDRLIIDNYAGKIKTLVAFSGEVEDSHGRKCTEANMNDGGVVDDGIREKFKEDDYKILVVAEKFQTGFDQPLLHTMYVDRMLGGIQCIQTLSRLNRCYPGKEDTMVIDFRNDHEKVQKAFQEYYTETTLEGDVDTQRIYTLKHDIEQWNLFNESEVESVAKALVSSTGVSGVPSILKRIVDERVMPLEDDEKDRYRKTVSRYVRQYGFLAQLIDFTDPDLERFYIFCKVFYKFLPYTKETLPMEILDLIDLDKLRIQMSYEGQLELEDEEQTLRSSRIGEPGQKKPDNELPVSEILNMANSPFAGLLNENDKILRQIWDAILSDPDVVDAFHAGNSYDILINIVREKFDEKVALEIEKYYNFAEVLEREQAFTLTLVRKFVDALAERTARTNNFTYNEEELKEILCTVLREEFEALSGRLRSLEEIVNTFFFTLNETSIPQLDGVDGLIKTALNNVYANTAIGLLEKRTYFNSLVAKYEAFLKKLYYLLNQDEVPRHPDHPEKSPGLSECIFAFPCLKNLKYSTDEKEQKFKVYLDLLRQWRNDEAHLSPNATDEEVNAALKIVTSMYMFVVGNNITDLEMAGAL
jgi:type I restriction enzyme R subunit